MLPRIRCPSAAVLLSALSLLLAPWGQSLRAQGDTLTYTLDLTERAEDLFYVRLSVSNLRPENAIIQFASTAPGTYQVMDIGRFVNDFRAYAEDRSELPTERVSTNQWRLVEPERVREIRYSIAETWDTPVDRNRIYPMAGTSIESDHVLFNAHAVFGFPRDLQDAPIRLFLKVPQGWKVGTALDRDAEGALVADDYDHLVDSPILTGTLSFATLDVTGVPVEIYTYSKTGRVRSEHLLAAMDSVLLSAGAFLGKLPVDRYTFLFHFEGQSPFGGAWEHSTSSEYVFSEMDPTPRYMQMITDIAAHEFFHIVTPLNIHSEIIENFNFENPVPSEHVWLYEGVTEWASDAMQLRSGLKSVDRYLAGVIDKIRRDGSFDEDYSLSRLALTSYTEEGQRQYPNIYQRGALVAGLLDIRLLDLSGGEYGLQELILDLMDRYGKRRPFAEDGFFDVVVEMTYPEIGEFLDDYIRNARPLPIAEYYAKLGIRYVENEGGRAVRFTVDPEPSARQRALRDAWLSNPGTG